ncbi:BgTH12-04546 [Blumeria graminis f. sp. triticale]|uniref:Vacuolar protein sorting-associated protein 17 n=1 Tax=Blumeria graminis f. sp. triticale TaxID=1689686 RepID=A0A9W4CUB8_BLUGR|nr:BgTH12-04546 [Blumeria graminis f. sp. triticale]
MDYSHSIADDDGPVASPWESAPVSSPQDEVKNSFPPTVALHSPSRIGSFVDGFSESNAFDQGIFERRDKDSGTDSVLENQDQRPSTATTVESQSQDQQPLLGQTSPQAQDVPQQSIRKEGRRPEPQRYHRPIRQNQQPSENPHKLQAKITGLERIGRKDPILRFDVHTNLPKFRTTQFRDVRRTHSEFVKLADHLISSNPEALVPAVPPALTSAGIGTEEDEVRVKASLQKWLNQVCSNEVLMGDEEILLFIESDFGYSPMLRRKQPATGVRRKVIKQFAPPPDDSPELQNARPLVKAFYLGTMDAGHKVDRLVKARKGLGLAESDFGVKLGSMNVQEPHHGLANAYRKLGKIIQTTGDNHAAQGTAEATTIGDPLQYYSQDAFIVKETLTNRHILLRELNQAQQLRRNKSSAADRLRASSSVRKEKVDEAIIALNEAIANENELMNKTMRVTSNLLLEQRRWLTRTVAELKQSIREYAIREIEAERRTLATLEVVRLDIRAIDSSGGLSRLGRESHPAARRTSLASSQGAKGDAWSGVPRRADQMNRSQSGSLMSNILEANDGGKSNSASSGSLTATKEADDLDRVDARNAASRLAAATFL